MKRRLAQTLSRPVLAACLASLSVAHFPRVLGMRNVCKHMAIDPRIVPDD